MLNTISKLKKINTLKLFIFLVLLTLVSSCRELSVFFDPAKNAPKKQLKVVKRDKPNLSAETVEREVDPDSEELIEATDEEVAAETVVPNTTTNTNTATSINTNSAEPNADLAKIEQKAKAIVGRWKPADMQESIIFEFTASKNEGETYIGTFNFYVNGNRDEPAKYIVSRDKMIKLIQFGKESKIEVAVSADGKSMRFVNQDGEVSNLIKTNEQPRKQLERPQERPKAQQPKATPPDFEKYDQD